MSARDANSISNCVEVASWGIVMNSFRLSSIAMSNVPLKGFQRPGLIRVQFAAEAVSVSFPLPNLLAKPPSRSGCSKPPAAERP